MTTRRHNRDDVKRGRAGPRIPFQPVLARYLRDPEFRRGFEGRRDLHRIALVVRAIRQWAGLSQADLARRIGTSRSAVSRLERSAGKHAPNTETLNKILAATGIP